MSCCCEAVIGDSRSVIRNDGRHAAFSIWFLPIANRQSPFLPITAQRADD